MKSAVMSSVCIDCELDLTRTFSLRMQKKRDRLVEDTVNGESAKNVEASSASEDRDISVPKDLDLIALPQLCFPGNL